jgi:hypothetical protein
MKKIESALDRSLEHSTKPEFGSHLGLTNLAFLALTLLALTFVSLQIWRERSQAHHG